MVRNDTEETSIVGASKYLRRSYEETRAMARSGELPAQKRGNRWVIMRDELEKWARGKA